MIMKTKETNSEIDETVALENGAPVRLPADAPSDDRAIERAMSLLEEAEAAIASVDPTDLLTPPAEVAPKKTRVRTSVVMPVYNEQETILEIVDRVRRVGLHDEIVIVDDCSTDGTRDLLIELAKSEDIRVHLQGYNQGKGAALRTALQHARGDVVIIQDADLEYDPNDYAKLLAPIQRGEADVVYGSRFLAGADESGAHQDPSWLHRFGNGMLTSLSNLTTGWRLTDMETCYKVFRRDVLRGMTLRENRFGFEPELTAKLARRKCRVVEVPISYDYRSYAEGKKIGIRDALQAVWCILRYGMCD